MEDKIDIVIDADTIDRLSVACYSVYNPVIILPKDSAGITYCDFDEDLYLDFLYMVSSRFDSINAPLSDWLALLEIPSGNVKDLELKGRIVVALVAALWTF
jgi:hypothetical protein